MGSSLALDSKHPSIADAVRAIDVSVLIQVGWVARTDAGAVGDRGPGGMGVRAVLSRLRSTSRSRAQRPGFCAARVPGVSSAAPLKGSFDAGVAR
jgi:hypothetical protein